MKKWLAIVSLFAIMQVQAFDGCVEGYIDGLYWRPCATPWQVAEVTPPPADGIQQTNLKVVKPDYSGGFKAQVGYYPCNRCEFITLSWTYFKSRDNYHVGEDNLFVYFGDDVEAVDSIDAQLRYDYNRADLRVGRNVGCRCNSRLYSYVGLLYFDVTKKMRYKAINGDDMFIHRERSQFDGWGLQAGIGAEHGLGCGFGVIAELGIFGAAGDRKLDLKTIDTTTPTQVEQYNYPTHVVCVPGFDFKVGLNYNRRIFCGKVVGEIGYRGDYIFNGFLSTQPRLDSQSLKVEGIGFGGPYVGLRLLF